MFYIVRIALCMLIIFILSTLFILIKKRKKKKLTSPKLKALLLVANSILLCTIFGMLTHISFEDYLFSFSSAEDSFRYSYGTKQIYAVTKNSECSFIAYNQGIACVNKTEEKRYKVIPRNNSTNRTFFINFTLDSTPTNRSKNSFFGTRLYNEHTNQTYIEISKAFVIEDTIKENITDTFGNTYELYETTTNGLTLYHYYTVIPSAIPKDYAIFVNGEKHNCINLD